MLRVGCLLLLLCGLTWLAAEVPSATAERPVDTRTQWRRTRNGWEHPTWLDPIWLNSPRSASRSPSPHPALVALFELFLVSAILVASVGSERNGHNRGALANRAA